MKKIALIGVLGYGRRYLNEIIKNGDVHDVKITALVDISPKAKEEFSELLEQGVKLYETMEQMYSENDIDLAIISSPIQLHSPQACFAMEHGSHVLVEKPLSGCLADAQEVIRVRDKTNRKILIGYQQIYDDTIRKVKEVILSGKYGKMLGIKCIALWPRGKDYFSRNKWVGKLKDKDGKVIRDSVANNANAHHLMNVLFLAGHDINSAAEVTSVDVNLFKYHDIETFDTCEIIAKLNSSIDMLTIVSHVVEKLQHPKYMIKLENGYITSEDDVWKLVSDGKTELIGQSSHSYFRKIWDMVNYIDDDTYLTRCTLECARAHTDLIEQISNLPVKQFIDDVIETKDGHIYINGLGERLLKTYEEYM